MNWDFDWNMMPCGVAYCKIETEENGERYVLDSCNQEFLERVSEADRVEKICQKDISNLISEPDKERFFHYISDIMASDGEICVIECNVVKPDGTIKDIYWRGRKIEEDNRTGILFSIIDFDSYKRERTMLLDAVHVGQAELNRLINLISYLPVGVAVFKEEHGFVLRAANNEFYRLAGYTRQQMVEQNVDLFDCIYPVDRGLLRDALEDCRKGGQAKEIQIRIQESNGEIHWVILQCNLYPIKPEVMHFSVACWDITERKNLEDELHLLAEQYQLLQELSDEIPMEYDIEKKQYHIPAIYTDISKKHKIEYISQDEALEHMHPDDKDAYLAAYEAAAKTEKKGTIEFRIHDSRCKTPEEYFWYRTVYRSVAGPGNHITHVIGKSYDITADKERQLEMSHEMRLDPLTRVYNKVESQRLVDEYLALESDGTHVLYLVDVDNFKRINDTFGHAVGDTIIIDMSRKIRESFRNSDIVGRIGGDEFIVFMKNTTEDFARIKAEQLCKNAKKVVYGGNEKLQVTISVGIAIYGKDGSDYATLFEKADTAMYKVKKVAKNGYAFLDGTTGTADEERKIPNAIVTNGEHADKEILNLAFNLLSHAKDLDVSLNLLLEQIGKRFAANSVSVFVYDKNYRQMTLTNIWSNIGKIYEKEKLPRDWTFFDEEPVGVFVDVVKAAEKAGFENPFRLENWNPQREPIRSMGTVKFKFANDVIGELDVASTKANVEWNEENRETICELAHVVSVFVSLRAKIWEDRQTIHMLRHRERLTGLYDRDTFRDKIEKIIKTKNPDSQYAVVVMDINNFAYVNENFGSNVGDKILCDLADSLTHTSPHILFASRMYSDYFSAFVQADGKEEIIDIVRKGTGEYEETLKRKYPMGSMGVSVGLCFFDTDDDYETVMENANIARKYAKEHKIVNGIVFSEYMREKRDEIVKVSTKFQDAIRNGEFEMYLQPKFLIGSWEIYGAEALARWKQPDGAVIGPDHFVSALEMNGHVTELDFYIFEKLLATMREWMTRGKKLLTISTNFSRKHFEKDGQEFIRRIQKAMDYYRVPAEYIEIEITESAVIENLDVLQNCMEELKNMGFRIAIDDFGTGYSSLNAVLEIPANVIKMDKIFTDKLNQERKRKFVSKMGLVIKAARQEVLFEGIETEEQLKYLKASGFKYGQGFLFDKPLKVEEFEQKYL